MCAVNPPWHPANAPGTNCQHTLEPVEGKCGEVVTGTLCGSRCCNDAAVHNYNRWLKSFSSEKPLRFGRWATLLPDDTGNHNIPHFLSTILHTHTLSHILSVFLTGSVFFLWCLPFHWLCLMQECVFLCLTLARGNNTSHWMVVCSGAFSDIQSLFF